MTPTNHRSTVAVAEPSELEEFGRHALLAHPVRRTLLEVLQVKSSPVTLDELADMTAPDVAPTATEVALACHHVHLPKLEAFGVLAYDASSQVVINHDVDDLVSSRE